MLQGDISTSDADQMLKDATAGTFLFRLSTKPGHLAVSFQEGHTIRHSLVRITDNGYDYNDKAYKTIGSIVGDFPQQLKYCLFAPSFLVRPKSVTLALLQKQQALMDYGLLPSEQTLPSKFQLAPPIKPSEIDISQYDGFASAQKPKSPHSGVQEYGELGAIISRNSGFAPVPLSITNSPRASLKTSPGIFNQEYSVLPNPSLVNNNTNSTTSSPSSSHLNPLTTKDLESEYIGLTVATWKHTSGGIPRNLGSSGIPATDPASLYTGLADSLKRSQGTPTLSTKAKPANLEDAVGQYSGLAISTKQAIAQNKVAPAVPTTPSKVTPKIDPGVTQTDYGFLPG
jgi:hypothetical protein